MYHDGDTPSSKKEIDSNRWHSPPEGDQMSADRQNRDRQLRLGPHRQAQTSGVAPSRHCTKS